MCDARRNAGILLTSKALYRAHSAITTSSWRIARPDTIEASEVVPMVLVGGTDAFERRYMAKFRALASAFGEFVSYERDRGARDIGLHLTRRLSSGKEALSSALCWFQMKGIMASSCSKEDFDQRESVGVALSVQHLRY